MSVIARSVFISEYKCRYGSILLLPAITSSQRGTQSLNQGEEKTTTFLLQLFVVLFVQKHLLKSNISNFRLNKHWLLKQCHSFINKIQNIWLLCILSRLDLNLKMLFNNVFKVLKVFWIWEINLPFHSKLKDPHSHKTTRPDNLIWSLQNINFNGEIYSVMVIILRWQEKIPPPI